jgi:uncharacterized protein (TIGR00297 family)
MTNDARHSETARQLVHMAMGGFALLLRWLAWWQAVVLALAAFLFNAFVLPSLARGLYRPGDSARGLHGILFYPLSVLILLLLFPRRLDIVAAAWGILAIGDGIATIAGRAIGGPRWPWNRDKTVAGSSAFVIAGAAAAVFLSIWCRPHSMTPPPTTFLLVGVPIVAALAAAAVETIPIRLDDNLSVALSAGAVLWCGSLIDPAIVGDAWIGVKARLVLAIVTNVVVAVGGYRARTVSSSGAIVGAVIGICIFAAAGWQAWLLLFLTFIAASASSRLGLRRKTLLGIAEERGGRRGAGNAIANTGAAAVCAILALITPHARFAMLAFVAALAAGGGDTIASEIGKAWGRQTWSITSLQRVPPGTSGAMSIEGTAAGIVGALALAAAGALLGLVPVGWIALIVIGATAGSLLESWLGATLEGPGILNNDTLNFINTATAALVTTVLAWTI